MIRIDPALCAGCSMCGTACPVEAIESPECRDFRPADVIIYWEYND